MFDTKLSASATSRKSTAQVGQFQARLAKEGQDIISVKFALKIAELDELCIKPEYDASLKTTVRQDTIDSLKKYFDECKRIEKKNAKKSKAGMNPLMALLGGGLSGGGPDDGEEEEMYEPEDEDESIQLPKKLLLDKISLDQSNKVCLKLSLELDTPESKKRNAESKASSEETSEPEAKKAKTSEDSDAKQAKQDEKDLKTTEKKDQETKDEKDQETKEEEKSTAKTEEEPEEEEEEDPIVPSNARNRAFANMLRGHIDEIVDWCTTIRAWLQSNISRNKNIGGADLKGEIQNEMLAEIQAVETELLNHKEIMAAYYVARGGILEKYTKEPAYEDYKVFILDEDEKHWVSLRAILIQMRNQTMGLFDQIQKDADELFSSGPSDKNDSFGFGAMY